jgi:hypothetical protein
MSCKCVLSTNILNLCNLLTLALRQRLSSPTVFFHLSLVCPVSLFGFVYVRLLIYARMENFC